MPGKLRPENQLARHGLTLGSQLLGKRFGVLAKQVRKLRLLLECECIAVHGNVMLQQALEIQTICREEQRILGLQRQLSIGGGGPDTKPILTQERQAKLFAEISNTSEKRDKRVEKLLGAKPARATGQKNTAAPHTAGLYDRPVMPGDDNSKPTKETK
ncbi:MAG TPA: hypothetical protein VMY42_14970 [Thermoguttaceae bacterium]|nr:hypothetical protein [Thermoguttaceae bacterium]